MSFASLTISTKKVSSTTATGGFIMSASATEPVGNPVNGTYWFDPDLNELDIYEVAVDSGVQKWQKASDVQYGSAAPTSDSGGNALANGDYWIDTDAAGYPVIYRHNGTAWVKKDNTDQSQVTVLYLVTLQIFPNAGGTYVASGAVLANGPQSSIYLARQQLT